MLKARGSTHKLTHELFYTNLIQQVIQSRSSSTPRVKKRRRLTSCRAMRPVDDRRRRYPLGEALWFSHFFIFQRSVSFLFPFSPLLCDNQPHSSLTHHINCSFSEKSERCDMEYRFTYKADYIYYNCYCYTADQNFLSQS